MCSWSAGRSWAPAGTCCCCMARAAGCGVGPSRPSRRGQGAAWCWAASTPSWLSRRPSTPAPAGRGPMPASPQWPPMPRAAPGRGQSAPRWRRCGSSLSGTVPAGPLAVISGASGAEPAWAEERGFLSAPRPGRAAHPGQPLGTRDGGRLSRPSCPWRLGASPGARSSPLAIRPMPAMPPPLPCWSAASAIGGARRSACCRWRRRDQTARVWPSPASASSSPLGFGVAANWAALAAGRSGIRRITRFPLDHLRTTIAGCVGAAGGQARRAPLLGRGGSRRMAVLAAEERWPPAGLGTPGAFPARCSSACRRWRRNGRSGWNWCAPQGAMPLTAGHPCCPLPPRHPRPLLLRRHRREAGRPLRHPRRVDPA